MKYPLSEDEMENENGQAMFELSPLYILDGKKQSIQMARSKRAITRRIFSAFPGKTTLSATIAEENRWIPKNS